MNQDVSLGEGFNSLIGRTPLSNSSSSTNTAAEDVDLSKPLGPTHDERGFIRFMPALIQEMNKEGVRFSLNSSTGLINVDGFYKNGPMTLEIGADDSINAIDRKGVQRKIKLFTDLINLNYEWWKRSTQKGTYLIPERPWLDKFIQLDLVKRQVIYLPKDEKTDEES